jgi:hypothetical protein
MEGDAMEDQTVERQVFCVRHGMRLLSLPVSCCPRG